MITVSRRGWVGMTILALGVLPWVGVLRAEGGERAEKKDSSGKVPATVEEARGRARLLHETIHGSLQVVHRDFFDPDNRERIPSATLEEVFEELAANWEVELHWLAVDGKTMNVDHQPQDAFEKKAVAALKSGNEEYEAVEENRYRHAGAIVLHNICLKCHVPDRKTLENRAAGLVISMPFGKEKEGSGRGEGKRN